MRRIAILAALVVSVGACANQQYPGVNYAEVTLPGGEHWLVAGGKDETNVNFEVTTSPDGSRSVRYSAEEASASAVIAKMAEQQSQWIRLITTVLSPRPMP